MTTYSVPTRYAPRRPVLAGLASVCAVLGLVALAATAEQDPGTAADIIHRESASLSAFFRRMETAFLNHDVEALSKMLSPRLDEAERRRFTRNLRREFDAVTYKEFHIDDKALGVLDGPVEAPEAVMYRVLVPCRYRYETKKEGLGSKVGVNDQAQRFWLEYYTPSTETRKGSWHVASSTLLDAMGLFNPAMHLGAIIFAAFATLIVAAFWLFAAFHRYRRTGSPGKALLLFLSTPIGAAIYFLRLTLSRPE